MVYTPNKYDKIKIDGSLDRNMRRATKVRCLYIYIYDQFLKLIALLKYIFLHI